MTAPLKRRGAAFFMLFGMEPFFSRGSGEIKRGKTAITFPGIPSFFGGCLFCYFKGDNAFLASPLGEEGHEVAKGCWRVRIGKKRKVEQAAYRRS